LQSVTCTGTDKPEPRDRTRTKHKPIATHKMALLNNNTKHLGLEIKQTEPGLVALYVIRSGNGAGLFLQPRAHTGQLNTDN